MTMTTAPVFDAHVDSLQRMLDLGHDLGTETPGHLDLVRGARGGLGAVVCVCCDPCHMESGGEGARRAEVRPGPPALSGNSRLQRREAPAPRGAERLESGRGGPLGDVAACGAPRHPTQAFGALPLAAPGGCG